jgi:uncharacterized membrane protein
MVLPEGFALPPWQLLVPLAVVLVGVVALLWAIGPAVTDRTVLAFAPWMMFGSTLHVLYRLEAYPDSIELLFGTPTVYAVTALLAGVVWLIAIFLHAAGLLSTIERLVGTVGTGFFVTFAMITIVVRWEEGVFEPFWPVIAVVLTGVVTAVVWIGLGLWFTDVAAVTGATGALVVFGHALDGVSTAIGYDVLGASEEVPVSRMILEAGHALPTAEYIGGGWLFVVAKVALALLVVGLFKEYVEDAPKEGRTLLALVAAVGLGPGIHNVLLFLVT